MSKLNLVRRCYNCGVVLQAKNKKKEGFIEKKIFDDPKEHILLCDKCYREEKYNLLPREANINPEFMTLLKDAQASDALIVYVIDLFSFEASFITEVNEALRGLKVLVVANKRDLMPKEVDDATLKEYVAHRLRVAKLDVVDVILTSQTANYNIDIVMDTIEKLRKRHDVYIIGTIAVGKTLLLKSLLRVFKNLSSNVIVTQLYPYTTSIKVMQIPLDNSSRLYDTPGLSNDNSIVSKVERDVLIAITPSKQLKRRSAVLNYKQALMLGGLARIDLLSKKKIGLTIYTSDEVDYKKLYSHSLDKEFNKCLERGVPAPSSVRYQSVSQFNAFDISIEESGERDIGIEGLGWISFMGDHQKFRIYVPKGVSIYTTRAKIKHAK